MDFRPELLALLSAHPPEVPNRPGEVVASARRHGLSGVLAASRAQLFPEPHRAQLLSDARDLAAQTLRTQLLLARCLEGLAPAGVKAVALKGYALGARIYPDPLLRPSTDVDLLIRPEEWEAATRVLESLGLQPMQGAPEAETWSQHHHFEFQGSLGTVELHFRPLAAFGSGLEWDHLRPPREARLGAQPIFYLDPADELLYLALHASQHLFVRLCWLYDLQRFVEHYPALDWDRVEALAKQLGLRTSVWCALDAARRCFRAEVPGSLLGALRPQWLRALHLRALFSPSRLVAAPYAESKWRSGLTRMELTDGNLRRGKLASQSFHRLGGRLLRG